MKLIFSIFASMVAFSVGCVSAWASVPEAPTGTRVIDWFEPLGVDTQAPRFGWIDNDVDRGEWQSAYQIVVATNQTDLDNNLGSAWDSGKVISNQQFGIVYKGTPLAKTSRYWWKVRTWDKDGQISPWGANNIFVTGFFQVSDWNVGAQWIRLPRAVSATTDVPGLYRKTFFISKPVKRAYLYATGLGQFVASLNGAKVGNHVIDPPWTVYDYLTYYVTFDVTALPSGGVLAAQSSPPVVTQQVLPGLNISSPSANNYIFDFGKNMNGQFEITVSGNAGAQVSLTPGEFLNGNGTVNPGRSGTMTYTLKGGGPEVWRQTFSTVGMRYVQVGGVSTNAAQNSLPYIQSVTGYFTYTASASVGSFSTSDARYNAIHDLVLEAFRSNLASTHTDGPNYEKLGWQEVVWTTLFSTVYEHDLYNLYAKILRDVRVGQRTNGLCGTIAPNYFTTTNSPSGGMYDDAPDWGSAMFSAPWQIYQSYGDLKILADNYGAMTNYLAYMKSLETGAGVVTYNGLGDWMAPAGRIVSNQEGVVYVMDTRILRDAAKALGKAADANYYSNEFVRVQAAYNNTFFDAATARYLPVCQANLAMPLVFGVVPAGSEQAVANSLVHDVTQPAENTAENGQNGTVVPNHITAGDIGNTFVWQALGDYGQNELVQTMILQSTSPGYLAMISEGETSLAENWNVSNIRSHNHDMMGGIDQWFYRTVGGISSLQPGYAQIQLKPGMPAGLTNATASYNCVRGLISSAWTRAANTIQWNVSVPVSATAKVYVPTLGTTLTNVTVAESGTTIIQNGEGAASVPGVAFDHAENSNGQSFIVFNVGSGSYQFAWNVLPAPTGVAATAADQQVSLTWNATGPATGYNVKRSLTSGGPYTVIATNQSTASYTDTGLTNGTAYYYVVSALYAGGQSANSLAAGATPNQMLLNRAGGGMASASTEGSSTETSAQAFDGNVNTKWYVSAEAPQWLQYKFGGGVKWVVVRYDISCANDMPQRDPLNWQFQGSNDGTTWITLDTQSHQSFPNRLQTLHYPVNNATTYQYYRLYVTANRGGSGYGTQLSELALMAYGSIAVSRSGH